MAALEARRNVCNLIEKQLRKNHLMKEAFRTGKDAEPIWNDKTPRGDETYKGLKRYVSLRGISFGSETYS